MMDYFQYVTNLTAWKIQGQFLGYSNQMFKLILSGGGGYRFPSSKTKCSINKST